MKNVSIESKKDWCIRMRKLCLEGKKETDMDAKTLYTLLQIEREENDIEINKYLNELKELYIKLNEKDEKIIKLTKENKKLKESLNE